MTKGLTHCVETLQYFTFILERLVNLRNQLEYIRKREHDQELRLGSVLADSWFYLMNQILDWLKRFDKMYKIHRSYRVEKQKVDVPEQSTFTPWKILMLWKDIGPASKSWWIAWQSAVCKLWPRGGAVVVCLPTQPSGTWRHLYSNSMCISCIFSTLSLHYAFVCLPAEPSGTCTLNILHSTVVWGLTSLKKKIAKFLTLEVDMFANFQPVHDFFVEALLTPKKLETKN